MTKEINKEELLVQQEYIEKVKAINAKREDLNYYDFVLNKNNIIRFNR